MSSSASSDEETPSSEWFDDHSNDHACCEDMQFSCFLWDYHLELGSLRRAFRQKFCKSIREHVYQFVDKDTAEEAEKFVEVFYWPECRERWERDGPFQRLIDRYGQRNRISSGLAAVLLRL